MKKQIIFFACLIFILFFSLNSARATEKTIVISEIGAYETTNHEWIEITNLSNVPVNIQDWKFWENNQNHGITIAQGNDFFIEPMEFAIIAQDAGKFLIDYSNVTSTVFDSSWGTLKEEGEEIGLKNKNSEFIEKFTYLQTDAGSLQKKDLFSDDYTGENWFETKGNSSGRQNILAKEQNNQDQDEQEENEETAEQPNDTNSTSTLVVDDDIATSTPETEESFLNYDLKPGDIVINEFVFDPQEGQDEFVELFNNAAITVDLSGWKIEDGSETKTELRGSILPLNFFVIEKPSGKLNNDGDRIILYMASGTISDAVSYGKWDDGNIDDNAQVADYAGSLARKVNGRDFDCDIEDFLATEQITKAGSNIIKQKQKADDAQSEKSFASNSSGSSANSSGAGMSQNNWQNNTTIFKSIIINEIFPNPEGSDSDDEFIELKNIGSSSVFLKDWKISDSTSKKFIINQEIRPNSFLVLKRKQTGIALNNTGGDLVRLYDADNNVVEEVLYVSTAPEGASFSRSTENMFEWTSKVTENAENIIEKINKAPEISVNWPKAGAIGDIILFDASDTFDFDMDEIEMSWKIEDKEYKGSIVKHQFAKPGNYIVYITARDSKGGVAEKKIEIEIEGTEADATDFSDIDSAVDLLEITEIFPNPEGPDTGEFIEIFNPSEFSINLFGLKIDDAEGGSKPYIIPKDTIVQPLSYVVFFKSETGLSLNNTSDSVRLLLPDNSLVLKLNYESAIEGASYSINDGVWSWTVAITPGEDNIIEAKEIQAVAGVKKDSETKSIAISEVKEFDEGDNVEFDGLVGVLPGVFGSQYFYIVDFKTETGQLAGVQIYMNKKEFPEMNIGDAIHVIGEIGNLNGELRIKVKDKKDIYILQSNAAAIEPNLMKIDLLENGMAGGFVAVQGLITELKSSYMYVDDGTDEIKVYFKQGTGIKKTGLKTGDEVFVSGFLNSTKAGLQILPRSVSDIVKIQEALPDNEQITISSDSNNLEKDVAEKYLTATAGGITSLLVALFAKTRGTVLVNLIKRIGISSIAGIIKIKRG
jgi:hypothetical protein